MMNRGVALKTFLALTFSAMVTCPLSQYHWHALAQAAPPSGSTPKKHAPFKDIDESYRSNRSMPPESTPTGFRVDRSYKDPAMMEALLRAYSERFKGISRLVEIGRTANGRGIFAMKISDNPDSEEDEPAVLLTGGTHGGELLSTEFALDAIQYLLERYESDQRVRHLVDSLEIWCIPQMSPDGTSGFIEVSDDMDRKNARDTNGNGRIDPTDGVDLNRNFPFWWNSGGEKASRSDPENGYYRGPRAASERETQALMRLADSEKFVASISFHTQANSILVPYTIDNVKNPKPNEAWNIAVEMSKAAGAQPNGRPLRVRRNIYSVDGVDQDWLRATHGTVAFIVEGAYENPLDPRTRIETIATTRPTWMALFERYLNGPSVYGHVRDSKDHPLTVEVEIVGVVLQEGEKWTNRCRDGRFDRFVDRPGRYTVRAAVGGKPSIEKTVSVGTNGPTRVEIVIPESTDVERRRSCCADESLCAIDSLCLSRQGSCVRPGLQRFHLVDGVCKEEDATGDKPKSGSHR